jgi:hypothetical protein
MSFATDNYFEAVSTGGLFLCVSHWTIAELIEAALATQPITPTTTTPDRRKRLQVIDGGRS